jgi:hypothetical protein
MLLSFAILGCGGSLSEEQRKQMREARELQAIRKVSEAEITEAAFRLGREITAGLRADSPGLVNTSLPVLVQWVEAGSSAGSELEQMVIDAYLNSFMMGEPLADNVQRLGSDSLLYSRPVVVEQDNGVMEVKGVWNVRMSRKQLVLAMDKE